MSVAKRALRGILCAYGAFGLEKLSMLLVTVVLARVLPPDEFSLVPTLMLLLLVADSLRDFGIKDALVYLQDREEDYATTGFVLIMAAGFLQAALTLLLAPMVAGWLHEPRLGPLFQPLSLTFILNALGNTHDALLQKNLRFERLYSVNLTTALAKTAIVLGGVFLGFGIWSVVWGQIVGSGLRAGLRWRQSRWRPHLGFHRGAAATLLRYGIHPTIIALAGPLLGRADQFAIITFMGQNTLGLYYIAARLPELLVTNITGVLSGVLFPTFASLQSDRSRLRQGFLFAIKATASVSAPISLGTLVVAPDLVEVLFGPAWVEASPVLGWLSLASLMQAIPWVSGDAYKAVGRPDLLTKLIAVESVFTLALIWGGTAAVPSLMTTAIAVCASQMLSCLLRLWAASRVLALGPLDCLRAVAGPVAAAATMALAVEGWQSLHLIPAPLAMLASSVALGAAVYVALFGVLERQQLRTLMAIVRARMGGAASAAE